MKTSDLIKCFEMNEDQAAVWISAISVACDQYQINTPLREAAFLAQCGHESNFFKSLEENLNYSAAALMEVWPKRFDVTKALDFARQPQRIANEVYADRMGNGDSDSGEGWRYRGRGIMQITGKDDYRDCSLATGLDLLGNPDLLLLPPAAAISAGWEWDRGHLNALADAGEFEKITRIINGGVNGETHRLALYQVCKAALGIA